MSDARPGAVDADDAHPAPAAPVAGAHDREPTRSFFAELPVLVLIAFVLALLLKTFLVQAFYIPSSSMEPTLDIGDRVLVNKVVYELRDPARGDVVVFAEDQQTVQVGDEPLWRRALGSLASGLGLATPGEKDFIKRIIGLPGDVVEVRDGVVYVNAQPLPEAPVEEGGYLSARDLAPFGPITVPQGEYFVMGDNRPNSADSRTLLGTISREQILGRAFVVIWPIDHAKRLPLVDYGIAAAAADAYAPAA